MLDTIALPGFNSCHYYFVNLFPTPSSAEFQVRRAVKIAPLTGIDTLTKNDRKTPVPVRIAVRKRLEMSDNIGI